MNVWAMLVLVPIRCGDIYKAILRENHPIIKIDGWTAIKIWRSEYVLSHGEMPKTDGYEN